MANLTQHIEFIQRLARTYNKYCAACLLDGDTRISD